MKRLPLLLTLLMCFGAAGATMGCLRVFTIHKAVSRIRDDIDPATVDWALEEQSRANIEKDQKIGNTMKGLWATAPYVGLAMLALLVHRRVWPACAVVIATFVIAAIGILNFQSYGGPHGPDFGALSDAFTLLVVPVAQWIMFWVAAALVAAIWFWPRRSAPETPLKSVPTAVTGSR